MERNPGNRPKPAGPAGSGLGQSSLDLALSRIGFDGAPDSGLKLKPAPRTGKAAPAPARGAGRDASRAALDLARREWLLDVMEKQRRLSSFAGSLVRCDGMERDQFLDLFYAPGRPCLVTGAIDHWPALGRWSPAYLRERIGDAPVEYQGGREEAGSEFEIAKARHKRVMPFSAYLDMILGAPGNNAYITANNSDSNSAAFAPLMADTGPIPFCLGPEEGMVWIGPAGTFTPLHFDLTNNLLVQVAGTKRILIVPPAETRYLYHRRHVFSEVHDLEDQARLALYPLAREAKPFEITLAPGEVLYLPIGWWHQVRSLEFSVTLTYTGFLWPNLGYGDYPADTGRG
jgi:Cupin-like domain